MKITSIVGARPQFIKAAMLSKALGNYPESEEVLIHTGQHYDVLMSDVFFKEMNLPEPKYNLNIGSGSHGAQTGKMLEMIEEVILREKPDWMVVYGDTNSTLAGALAAAKLHIPIAHVEAGLRSFNRKMPEEINRLIADQLATIRFTPTNEASANLISEGYPEQSIAQVGDVMYDAVLHYSAVASSEASILDRMKLDSNEFVLATIHRAENTDSRENLEAIISALNSIHEIVPVIWPMHPRTEQAIKRDRLDLNLQQIEPVGYLDMLQLEREASVIITDSGGVQKEAYFQQTPCVTVRTETEWVELIETGWNRLANPTDPSGIVTAYNEAKESSNESSDQSLYGDGHSADRMAENIVNFKGQ